MTPDKQAAPSEWVERAMELAAMYSATFTIKSTDAAYAALRAHLESREAEFQLLEKDITEFREAIAIANERMDRYEALVKQLVEDMQEIEERTRPNGDMADRPVNELARAALAAYQEKT